MRDACAFPQLRCSGGRGVDGAADGARHGRVAFVEEAAADNACDHGDGVLVDANIAVRDAEEMESSTGANADAVGSESVHGEFVADYERAVDTAVEHAHATTVASDRD